MKAEGAKHNLVTAQFRYLADILEEEQESNERDFSFSWSRPVALYALVAWAISKKENL